MSSRLKVLTAPAALILAGGLVWFGSAAASGGGFDAVPQLAQAAPPAAQPPAAGGGPVQPGMPGQPPMMMRNFSPKDMCTNHVARRIGNRAYMKARLDLKPEQVPLWNTFEKAADEQSAKDKARCATLPTEIKTPPTMIERMTMREDFMKARLASLEAVKPSLTALYASLTPEQKTMFDKPMMGGRGRHHHRHG
jgi:hypothetical protein